MATSTAFVTGASGFVGGALVRDLVADRVAVRALVRSDGAARRVEALGAEPVRGDVSDREAIREGARGCSLAFHAAALASEWGPVEEYERVNVEGTRNVLAGCAAAGVERLVHVGTEAALLGGEPLINADEDVPLRPDSKAPYSATKARAEMAVLDANRDGFETVVVRPRLVWGVGDTSILPALVEAVDAGRFAWIGGGRHLTSTTNIANAVHGLRLGAERGRAGGVYFVTDGGPVVFRDFISELLATQGIEAPSRNIPRPLAGPMAAGLEGVWRTLGLKGSPPLTRLSYWLSALETTIDISRARRELGYEPVTTIEEGMGELRA